MDFRNKLRELLFVNETEKLSEQDLIKYVQGVIAPNQEQLPILYRFSPADYYNIRALETQTLYLTEASRMNDVFEGVASTTASVDIEDIQTLQKAAFLKSFTESYEEIIMWSRYADNFSGMCVSYDFRKSDALVLFHLFPVVYTSKRFSAIPIKEIVDSMFTYQNAIVNGEQPNTDDNLYRMMPLFLVKSCHWAIENEWRFLVTLPQLNEFANNRSEEQASFFYDLESQNVYVSDCIQCVYLGPIMPKEKKKHIREICEKLHIEVREMRLHPTEYKLTSD